VVLVVELEVDAVVGSEVTGAAVVELEAADVELEPDVELEAADVEVLVVDSTALLAALVALV
jgi:hypothetical protein